MIKSFCNVTLNTKSVTRYTNANLLKKKIYKCKRTSRGPKTLSLIHSLTQVQVYNANAGIVAAKVGSDY